MGRWAETAEYVLLWFVMCSMWQMFADGLIQLRIPVAPVADPAVTRQGLLVKLRGAMQLVLLMAVAMVQVQVLLISSGLLVQPPVCVEELQNCCWLRLSGLVQPCFVLPQR